MPDSQVSILIVDDEPPIRSLLVEVLSPEFQCACAESASAALALIDSRFFHLALVDPGLPDMSGVDLCRLIVNRTPRTAVVMVSGNTDSHSIDEAIKAGAADYITKPFALTEVLEIVERVLRRCSPDAFS